MFMSLQASESFDHTGHSVYIAQDQFLWMAK